MADRCTGKRVREGELFEQGLRSPDMRWAVKAARRPPRAARVRPSGVPRACCAPGASPARVTSSFERATSTSRMQALCALHAPRQLRADLASASILALAGNTRASRPCSRGGDVVVELDAMPAPVHPRVRGHSAVSGQTCSVERYGSVPVCAGTCCKRTVGFTIGRVVLDHRPRSGERRRCVHERFFNSLASRKTAHCPPAESGVDGPMTLSVRPACPRRASCRLEPVASRRAVRRDL